MRPTRIASVRFAAALLALLARLAAPAPAPAIERLDAVADAVRDATRWESDDGRVTADVDLYVSLDDLWMSQPPPGIIENPGRYLASPRLSMLGTLEFDRRLALVVLGRADRGFDPTDGPAEARPDEYFLRLDPLDGAVRLSVGKIGTVFGQWSRRYLEWKNPMTNAPLAYEWITTVGDGSGGGSVAPSRAEFLARKRIADLRDRWVPAIWGPSYTSGLRLDGSVGIFDYAFEVKNDAPSARPQEWDLWHHGIDGGGLAWGGRIGARPDPAWSLGLDAASGAYLVPGARGVPAGRRWSDYRQNALGADAAWAHGPFEAWSEVVWSSFQVPGPVGTVALVSYFLEGRWKVAPGWWLAGRWNQQLHDTIAADDGRAVSWDDDVWRVDACLGWRVDRTLTLKAQYSHADQAGPVGQGRNLVDLQVVLGF